MGIIGGEIIFKHFDIADDNGEEVIEIMGDTASHNTDRF